MRNHPWIGKLLVWRIIELPYSQLSKQQEALQDNAEAENMSDTIGFADSLAGTGSFMISFIWPFPVPCCQHCSFLPVCQL